MAAQDMGLAIKRIVLDGATVVLEAEGTAARAPCPDCGQQSERVHARYVRRPLDQPWRGWTVRFDLCVRRFRCEQPSCPRVTFVEPLDATLGHRAQRTRATDAVLREVAQTLGGEAGARVARAMGVPISGDTLLRLLRREPVGERPAPRVLGVDDLALRKGHHYATLLVDLERDHTPVDLLEGREARVLADWLRDHPGVEIVVRDRSGAYAEGTRAALPDALQIADRFHLLQNVSQALIDVLRGRPKTIEIAGPAEPLPPANEPVTPPTEPSPTETEPAPARPLSPTRQREAEARQRRIARWERVRELHAAGEPIGQIAREVGITHKTVRRLAAQPEPPRNRCSGAGLDRLAAPALRPYVPHLEQRWAEGCTSIAVLFREIVSQGYPGSYPTLWRALHPWRARVVTPTESNTPTASAERSRSRTRTYKLRRLCLRPRDALSTEEQAALTQVLDGDPDLTLAHTLKERFRCLVRDRDPHALMVWVSDAQASGLASFVALANGLQADEGAVRAALQHPWSTGPVEGHVHRVKLLKRQHYGRAKLDLLRRRVLAA